MKCVVCHGQEIAAQKVNEEISVGADIALVPVEVSLCQSCGERYYDRKTMQFLEKTRERLKKEHPPLQQVGKVLRYA